MVQATSGPGARRRDPATGRREEELPRLALGERAPSPWQRLCPLPAFGDPFLTELEDLLDDPDTAARLAEHDRSETWPAEVVERLHALGWHRLLIDDADDAAVTPWHLCACNAITARRDASVAITVGVNYLALLPVHLGGSDAQRAEIGRRVRGGALCSLLLTELAHGSNLLRNQARAEPGTLDAQGVFHPCAEDEPVTHYRVHGDKELINGGQRHALLFALLRTRGFDAHDETSAIEPLRDRASFGVFWIERGEGVSGLPRWHTLPARGADISGVRFRDVLVPADRVIGRPQGGFTLIRKTLILSRGGIAALASGCLSRARDLAARYARRRNVYGAPIAGLGAIGDHLLRLEALDLAAAALSLKAAACANAMGLAAAHYTAVAKRMACRFAEEGVEEGRQVLGGRALLQHLPYERLIRDVTLYGVFDGTSHLMLDELSARLAQEATRAAAARTAGPAPDTLARMREVYARPPTRVLDLRDEGSAPEVLPLERHLRALDAAGCGLPLEPLAEATDALFALVRALQAGDAWKTDQGLRLAAADALATLEAATALVELADAACRRALGLGPVAADDTGSPDVLVRFGASWLAERALAGLRAVAHRAPAPDRWLPDALAARGGLDALEQRALAPLAGARSAWLRALAASSG